MHSLPLKPDSQVRIVGATRPGGFFTDFLQQRVELIAQRTLPEPRQIGEDELLLPALDSQWVEVPAVVTGVESDSQVFTLIIEVDNPRMVPPNTNKKPKDCQGLRLACRLVLREKFSKALLSIFSCSAIKRCSSVTNLTATSSDCAT